MYRQKGCITSRKTERESERKGKGRAKENVYSSGAEIDVYS